MGDRQPDDPNLPTDHKLANALMVMILDRKIRHFLIGHDPKALEQALDAVQAWRREQDDG